MTPTNKGAVAAATAIGAMVLSTLVQINVGPASAAQGSPPSAGSAPVTIVNPLPLPVTGTVNLGQGISITNTPNVIVTNTNANPLPTRDVDNPALQPFQHAATIGFTAGTLGGNRTFTVPSGQRLVIEFVSFSLVIPTGQKPTFNFVSVVNSTANQSPIDFLVPLTYQATGIFAAVNSDVYVGSSPTRLYADPGSTVTLAVRREGSTGSGLGTVTVSGHLVNVP